MNVILKIYLTGGATASVIFENTTIVNVNALIVGKLNIKNTPFIEIKDSSKGIIVVSRASFIGYSIDTA